MWILKDSVLNLIIQHYDLLSNFQWLVHFPKDFKSPETFSSLFLWLFFM